MMTPRQAFNKRYNIIRYGSAGKYFYELNKGEGLYGKTVYGVSVIYKDDVFADTNKHICFHSLADAEEYIRELRKESEI